jgi:hypothetical protein
MGALLSFIGERPLPEVLIDLESARPDPSDEAGCALYEQAREMEVRDRECVEGLEAYPVDGCQAIIRSALSFPDDAAKQEEAWAAVIPHVRDIMAWHQVSKLHDDVVPRLLELLTDAEALVAQAALARQVGR